MLSCVQLLVVHGLQPARLLCPWDSLGNNTGVGCHFFLQGIFLTQGIEPDLLLGRQILYHWATRKAWFWSSREGVSNNLFSPTGLKAARGSSWLSNNFIAEKISPATLIWNMRVTQEGIQKSVLTVWFLPSQSAEPVWSAELLDYCVISRVTAATSLTWEGLGHTLTLQCKEGGQALGLVLWPWVLVEPCCLENCLVEY